jgi:hypothetical protein
MKTVTSARKQKGVKIVKIPSLKNQIRSVRRLLEKPVRGAVRAAVYC